MINARKNIYAWNAWRLIPKLNPISRLSHVLHLDSYCKTDDSALVYSYNRVIDNHIKSGCLTSALQMFNEMPIGDEVSWNLLISGHKRQGLAKQALELYSQMVSHGVRESPSTFSSVSSICSNSGFYIEGLQVHCRVIVFGVGGNSHVGSSVVDLYMQIGQVANGVKVFDEMPIRNTAVWNLVLRGYCKLGLWSELLELYPRLKFDGAVPNEITLSYLIHGCCNGGFVDEGKQLHGHVVKAGLADSNVFIANAIVDFYSACGSLLDAQKSFEVIPAEDVISWNSIVSVHADNGLLFDALKYFNLMEYWGNKPSIRCFVSLLNLCSASKNLTLGAQFYCYVLKLGFDLGSVHVQSALIDMYGKCFEIESSVKIYEGLSEITRESCNALMTSLLYCGLPEDVFELFGLMVDRGIAFDEISLLLTLKAVSKSSSVSLKGCKLLHCCLIKSGFGSDLMVSCSLIDAYSKSGQVGFSRQVFNNLSSHNVVCFTSIINGYARNGKGRECLELLKLMVEKGLKPDSVTFLCVLMGCNHTGLVEEGKLVFDSMRAEHGVHPDRRHYSCMVDMLGRAGLFHEAEELIQESHVKDDGVLWSSLLRSCRVSNKEMLGQRVAERLLELESENSAACLQASYFFSEVGDWSSSSQCREMAASRKFGWKVGHSLIEVR